MYNKNCTTQNRTGVGDLRVTRQANSNRNRKNGFQKLQTGATDLIECGQIRANPLGAYKGRVVPSDGESTESLLRQITWELQLRS